LVKASTTNYVIHLAHALRRDGTNGVIEICCCAFTRIIFRKGY
jgi:hypothetical protein